jgi:hypothetical protein
MAFVAPEICLAVQWCAPPILPCFNTQTCAGTRATTSTAICAATGSECRAARQRQPQSVFVTIWSRYTFPVNPEFNKASVYGMPLPLPPLVLSVIPWLSRQFFMLVCVCLGTAAIGSTASATVQASNSTPTAASTRACEGERAAIHLWCGVCL